MFHASKPVSPLHGHSRGFVVRVHRALSLCTRLTSLSGPCCGADWRCGPWRWLLLLDGCAILHGTHIPHLLAPATCRRALGRFPRLGYGTEGCDDPGGCLRLVPLGVLSFPDGYPGLGLLDHHLSSSFSCCWTDPRLTDFPGVAAVVLQVWLIYSLVSVSAVQRSDSVLCVWGEVFRSLSITGEGRVWALIPCGVPCVPGAPLLARQCRSGISVEPSSSFIRPSLTLPLGSPKLLSCVSESVAGWHRV